VLLGR
jgi:DNA topoisomerase III